MNHKTSAIKKKTAERFENNSFAKKYKETNEARERSRTYKDSVPGGLNRK